MAKGDRIPLVGLSTPMNDAILEMTAKRLGLVGVTHPDGTLAGLITDGDLRRHLSPELLTKPAQSVMTKNPITVQGHSSAASAVHIMQERKITAVFVVDEGKRPLGVLHIHDCLQAGVI